MSRGGYTCGVEDRYSETWSREHYFAFVREFGTKFTLYSWDVEQGRADARVLEKMLHEPRFHEHLAMRYYSERDVVREYRLLQEQAQNVLTQLRSQLQES